jgi:ferric-dicitrate binding protein FerR (iron transport regulator)
MKSEDDNSPKHIKDLIIRFLKKETTPAEIKILEDWLKEDMTHRIQFDKINTTFHAISSAEHPGQSLDDAWETVSNKISEEDQTEITINPSRSSAFFLLKIAASVIIIMGIGWGVLNHYAPSLISFKSNEVVYTAAGDRTLIVLPDGSKVWLNANSALRYDADFGINSRDVKLKGEAFFDVTKSKIPFIVATDKLSIRVKGTRFNVRAFNNDGNERTTLEEGHVVLKVSGNEQQYDMKPGDQIIVNRSSNEVIRRKVKPSNYSAWKEERLEIVNESLGDIVHKLESRFGVTIEIDSVIAERENLTMTIHDETVGEVLELIKLSSSVKYSINNDHIRIYE